MVRDYSYIGRAVKADMDWTGTTTEKMARKVGKDVTTIQRYLSGKTMIPLPVLIDMDLSEVTWERIRKGGKK